MNDIVTIIIPTYKRADMLTKMVNALLNQTYKSIEIIVVDDNNPDDEYRKTTEQIMTQFADEIRVVYLKHPYNMNGSAARNTGFACAKGKYICFSDDDDIFFETKIEKQVEFLNSFSEYSACCCECKQNGKEIHYANKSDYTDDILLMNRTPQTSGIMFRRTAIEKLNGFDTSYIRHQDYELLLRYFAAGFKMGKIDEVLYSREITGTDNTPNGAKLEQVKQKFLSQFDNIIVEKNKTNKNFKKIVYIKHYTQLLKCYVKNKNYQRIIATFFKLISISPVLFAKEIHNQFKIRRCVF